MSNRHRWADIIIAWAEGKKIEWKNLEEDEWQDLSNLKPHFMGDFYRIKPEPKPDIRARLWSQHPNNNFHLTFVFDGETKAFKTVEFHDE